MFGYVKPDKPELKIKEYETYKAVYCSLCKTLGKQYGVFAKALLTYDATFYIFFCKAVSQDKPDCAHRGVCRFNPLKKCNYIDEDEILRRAAALSVIMFYYKILDNLHDSGFFKRLACRLALPYIKLKFKKAVKNYSYFNDIIKKSVEKQTELEKNAATSVDLACDPSSKALGEIFSYGIEDACTKDLAYRLGYCTGRWVYLMDAFDDLENDAKSGSFNPFVNKYSLDGKTASELDDAVLDGICGSVRMSAGEACTALEQIKKNCYSSILLNIIADGTKASLDRVIDNKKKGKG